MNFFDALPEPKQLYLASSAHSPKAIEEEPAIGEAILAWANQLPGLLATDAAQRARVITARRSPEDSPYPRHSQSPLPVPMQHHRFRRSPGDP